MLIGIISDTHNDMEMTRKAVDIFRQRGVDMVIHAGDITSPKMLQLFSGLNTRFVLGNEDLDVDYLNEESVRLGFGAIEKVCQLEIDGKRIIVFHGSDVPLFRDSRGLGFMELHHQGAHPYLRELHIEPHPRDQSRGASTVPMIIQ